MRVEIGFIATRTTSGAPVVMPPSRPPELLLPRKKSVGCMRGLVSEIMCCGSKNISSCTSDPRRMAMSKPRPISTPFMAWMLMRLWASRPSSFRS